jgi:hypothetical protein
MWERLWALIVQPDATIWAGIIGLGGAIFAGWLGGVIGGGRAVKAALLGAKRAHADNVRLAADAVKAQAVAFVQAIRTEFDALSIFITRSMTPVIEQAEADKPINARFILSEDYFAIYRANANLLGNIDDAQVRDVIVRAYLAAQGFFDVIRTNNAVVDSTEQDARAIDPSQLAATFANQMYAAGLLNSAARAVVNAHLEFHCARDEFFKRTQEWLETKGAMF